MDAVSVAEAVFKHRLPIFCSTCTRAKPGRDPICNAKRCGSPLARRDFPEYQGPIPQHSWTAWCFVCGGASDAAVQVQGSDRKFGMCMEHLPWLDQMQPVGETPTRGVEVITSKGRFTLEQLFPKKNSLRQTLAEADAYMNEQDRKKR